MDVKDLVSTITGETVISKKYDDRPMYEQNKPREDTGYTAAPKYKDYQAPSLINYKTPNPSPLHQWWHEEKRKQNAGLMNEHDINEIKVALKGVKNKWFAIVETNKDLIQKMVESKFDWQKLMELRNGLSKTDR